MQPIPFARVVMAGLLVAVSDGLFAVGICLTAGTGCVPIRVFWSIAAGLLGPEAARAGGVQTAALGLGLHVLIATIWATIYWLLYQRLPLVRRAASEMTGAIVVAIVYGFAVYLAMDFIVIPLSHARHTPISSRFFWIILLGHPLFVAAPIVWLVRAPRAAHVGA